MENGNGNNIGGNGLNSFNQTPEQKQQSGMKPAHFNGISPVEKYYSQIGPDRVATARKMEKEFGMKLMDPKTSGEEVQRLDESRDFFEARLAKELGLETHDPLFSEVMKRVYGK